jgi:hypothetical protein
MAAGFVDVRAQRVHPGLHFTDAGPRDQGLIVEVVGVRDRQICLDYFAGIRCRLRGVRSSMGSVSPRLIINSVRPTVTWHVCTWAMYSRVRLFMVGSLGGPVVSAASSVSVASVVVPSVVVSVVVALVSDSGDVADPIAMSSTNNPTADRSVASLKKWTSPSSGDVSWD